MEELRRQRDLAQSQVEELRKKLEEEKVCIFSPSFFLQQISFICNLSGLISNLIVYVYFRK